MHGIIRTVLSTALLGAAAGAAASEGGHRQHGAHEHGHATLQVALEGKELVAELRVPAVHVVGFEHAPANEAQRRAVREVLARFGDEQQALVPAAVAGCRLESHRVEMAGMDRDHDEEHGRDTEHGHDEEHARDERHGHDEEHAEREGHGHDKEHAHDEQHGRGEEAHSELHARYAWHCDSPERLDHLALRLFEQLDGLEEVEAQVVTPSLQTATELRPGATTLRLGR